MKASDLRIGNYVKNRLNGPRRIKNAQELYEIQEHKDFSNIDHPLFIEPIPLTEEWLLKFGLTKDKNVEYPEYAFWVKGAFNIYYNEDRTGFCFEVYSHYIPVQHVHQLQNLYFALTGEELTIKE